MQNNNNVIRKKKVFYKLIYWGKVSNREFELKEIKLTDDGGQDRVLLNPLSKIGIISYFGVNNMKCHSKSYSHYM